MILRNVADEILAKHGAISTKEIREVKLDMIANTGAVEVTVPQSIVDQLGLPFLRKARACMADGRTRSLCLHQPLQS